MKIALTMFCLVTTIFISRANSLPGNNLEDDKLNKECMNRVIALDDSLGKIRNHACEKISLSQSIKDYSAGMKKFSYKKCPESFKKAFERHRQAWANMLVVTDKYPDLRGEMHVLFKQLEEGKDAELFKPLLKAIWDTWAEVEKAIKENK